MTPPAKPTEPPLGREDRAANSQAHTPGPYDGKTLTELHALRDKGLRLLFALEMADLADQRVASFYEPYAPDSYNQLDHNFRQIERVRGALASLNAAIANADTRANDRTRETNHG